MNYTVSFLVDICTIYALNSIHRPSFGCRSDIIINNRGIISNHCSTDKIYVDQVNRVAVNLKITPSSPRFDLTIIHYDSEQMETAQGPGNYGCISPSSNSSVTPSLLVTKVPPRPPLFMFLMI